MINLIHIKNSETCPDCIKGFKFKSQGGFTIIEVAIVMGIFGALMLMGLFFDFTFYRGASFHTDVDAFASTLQRARAQAINNVNEANHGVYIDPDNYILFQGDDYITRDPSFDQPITRNSEFNFNHTEFAFESLSGDATIDGDSNFEGDIVITGPGQSATILINYEGLINR